MFAHIGNPRFLTIFLSYVSVLMDKYFRLYEKVSRKFIDDTNVNERHIGANILRKKDYETYQAIKYGSGIKSACMTGSTVMLIDLDLVKMVNQKDFVNFPDRHPPSYHSDPAMNKMLSFATGDEWKRLKSILTQSFSASRIRRVNDGLHKTAMKLCDFMRFQLNDPAAEGSQQLEIVSPINKYLLELIACSVFGLENTGIFVSNDSPFEIYTKQVQRAMIRHRKARQYPGLVQLAKLFNLFRPSADALRFFEETIHSSIDKRMERGETGDDLLQLLMEATSPNSKHNNGKLTTDMILSQALMFFFAGTEGPATLLVYGLYELAKNPDVQQRLYDEIAPVMDMDNCIDDVTLTKLEYLDMFVCEVLRMYSSSVIARRCQSKYHLPGTDIVIQPGTNVHTPIYGIHHDEEYYPNPFSFNPDNFTDEAKRKRPSGAYLTFGIGPRACIAQKFGLIQGKSAICHLVYNFHVKTCWRTESPPKGSIESMYLPINGLWLTLDDRKNKI
ncbi:hypothetical protein HA402_009768 [Bradysia odoriphaga]|nr:hypothetical protein HA402_009768 [Bradysia odoriphaga]